MKFVSPVLCLWFLASLLVADGCAQENIERPAGRSTVKSVEALEEQPAGEAPRKGAAGTPLKRRVETKPSARKAETAQKPQSRPAPSETGAAAETPPAVSGAAGAKKRPIKTLPHKPGTEIAKDVSEEQPVPDISRLSNAVEEEEKAVEKQLGITKSQLSRTEKEAEKGKGGPVLFSVEEAEKVLKEQTSIHKMVQKGAKGKEEKEGALFSVEEAEQAGRDQRTIHEMVSRKPEDEELFSVTEGEKAASTRSVPLKKKLQKPSTTRGGVEKKKRRKTRRKPTSIGRRKDRKRKGDDWVKIELGFAYKKVKLYQGSYTFETHFIGEMANNTGRDFGIVKFMFSTYDRRGKLISEEPFQVTDFYNGQVKVFKGTVIDGYKDIASHKIRFVSGAPTARG